MSERSTVLLEHHLKELKLPTFLREYGKVVGQCAAEGVDHPGYLLRLSELFEPTMESSASSRCHDQGWRRQSIASAKNAAIWPGEHFLTTLRITCPTTLSSPLCALK